MSWQSFSTAGEDGLEKRLASLLLSLSGRKSFRRLWLSLSAQEGPEGSAQLSINWFWGPTSGAHRAWWPKQDAWPKIRYHCYQEENAEKLAGRFQAVGSGSNTGLCFKLLQSSDAPQPQASRALLDELDSALHCVYPGPDQGLSPVGQPDRSVMTTGKPLRFAAIQACEQQLLQFRGLSGSLLRWLQTAQDQLPPKEANLNTEGLQTQSSSSCVCTGAPQINGSSGPSSVNGIHTCKDHRAPVAVVDERPIRDAGQAEEPKSWLADKEHSLKQGQTASSKPEVVRAQAQENKVALATADKTFLTLPPVQALLRELSSSVSALSERPDAQASLSAQPEALKRRLQETGEIRSELERRRTELAEAERLCQELSTIVAEPYLKEELSKRLESVSGPLKSLEERAADGLSQLQAALVAHPAVPADRLSASCWHTQTDELQLHCQSAAGSYELIQAEGGHCSPYASRQAETNGFTLQSHLASFMHRTGGVEPENQTVRAD
ncbi:microtubule-actin cross-linking factor 1 isoform X1 [Lates japonicus]|uniref:Microtubule-actin cross-linking factor 1 isoform X1 n=1 Tax=Lates japonicus TaxID=270547 RepID=A0AAD3RN10_LATJO|nr:microtubule-actin cross-linking factor 1 isoform X1 [Lates japonicus]